MSATQPAVDRDREAIVAGRRIKFGQINDREAIGPNVSRSDQAAVSGHLVTEPISVTS